MNERTTIGQLQSQRVGFIPAAKPPLKLPAAKNGPTFQSVLDQQFVKFSHHAMQRIEERGIRLEQDELSRIGGAIDKAAAKGAKDSLVLYQDMAFIVNVKNRTVVTAMDGSTMNEHVFTQIDSAVIVK